MPLLTFDDPLPLSPRRVIVAGPSGSGKSTTAGLVARTLGIPHHELDALHHGPNWTPRPDFERDVRRFAAREGWVTEWQYPAVRELLLARADLLIWLALPRRAVMRQVIARTLRRRFRHEILWNGNVEPPLRTILGDPQHVVRWSWTSYPKTPARMAAIVRDRPELPVVRLRSRREVTAWTAALSAHGSRPTPA
ncbi:P-loop NTPase family protein [Actinoplanes sp. RD1]|uniref:AAA family ATPase n=1 Tax=Actinoplanes sp. RD1 TaxID=3064538 RepID=UPI002741BCC3|nr:AAA family ATPase [Actinoplanes sp. RD1]